MLNYIINTESIILFLNGKPIKVAKDAPAFAAIIKAFRLPEAEQEAAILDALEKRNANKDIFSKGFVINGSEVTYEGEKMPYPLAQKIISLVKENLPVELFKPFWRELKKNPAYHVVNEIGFYDFLSYRELPMTQDGCFLAYKGIRQDGYSVMGNPATVVLQGKVDNGGHIYNGVGEKIEVLRRDVSDNRSVSCHQKSLHLGSLDYALGWGPRVVVVKVNPKDVVSVPNDCGCQKLRVCAYEVIGEFTEEIVAPVVSKKNTPIIDKQFKKAVEETNRMTDRIGAYLSRKKTDGYSYIQAKSIQGIFSPVCPSLIEILSAVTALGYIWENSDGRKIIKL